MPAVSYRINFSGGLSGEKGFFFDYILASAGLYVRSEAPLLRATIRIAEAQVRGLAPIEEKVELLKGKVPALTGKLVLNTLGAVYDREMYLAIVWENATGGYRLVTPPQHGHSASVKYMPVPNTLVDIHSHGEMSAFFSSIDDQDEQGMGIYVVVGELQEHIPVALLRIGIYGYFKELNWEDVFEL